MTVMDSLNTLTGSPLERVAALADAIRAGGNEAQQLRRVPSPTVDTLVEAGLFRFTIPRELGGEDATVLETIEVLEAISAVDGSVGWNVMLGSEINAMAAGGMHPRRRTHRTHVLSSSKTMGNSRHVRRRLPARLR